MLRYITYKKSFGFRYKMTSILVKNVFKCDKFVTVLLNRHFFLPLAFYTTLLHMRKALRGI